MFKKIAALAAGLWLAAGCAAAAAPALEDYGKLPGIEQMSISPSGQRYAMIALVNNTRTLLVLDASDKVLMNAPVGADLKIRDLYWGGDEFVLLDRSKTYDLPEEFYDTQAEIWQTVAVHVDKGSVQPIFGSGPPKDNGMWGYYGSAKVDGQWSGFFKGMSSVANRLTVGSGELSYDLYRVEYATGRVFPVDKTGDPDSSAHWLFGADGKMIARSNRRRLNGQWSLLVDGKRVFETQDRLGDYFLVGQGRAPGSVVFQKPDGAGGDDFMEWTPGAAEPVEILADVNARSLIHDPNTGELVGWRDYSLIPKLTFFDAARQARVNTALRPFAKQHARLIGWSTDFNIFLVYVEGDTESGAYYIVDVPAKKARQIGLPYPSVGPEDVGPFKVVRYKASDGRQIEAILTLPPGKEAKNLPVVMLPHGGPAGRDSLKFDWWAQAFANRGYAVLQPNFRGSTGYGREFEEAGWGEWGGKMQTDISDGLAYLASEGIADPKRACIVGASYGGYAAAAGVTLQQGLYRCAVAYAGVFDLQTMLNENSRTENLGALRYWRKSMGADTVKIAERSPLQFANRADAPILLIHGRDDTVVPISQSGRMEGALRGAGKTVEFVRLDGEDHWLSREASRTAMLKAAVAWVEKYNPAK